MKYGEEIKLLPPASAGQIAEAEQRLGARFSEELSAMLHETNGDCDFMLPLEEIFGYNEAVASEAFT